MSVAGREVLIVAREAVVAHPSFAKGGYVPLHAGATAYRNADFVTADPGAMLEWCRGHGCAIAELPAESPSTRRYRVHFPDEPSYAAFRAGFGR